MLDHTARGEALTAETIKDYHRILKTGTADSDKNWFAVGDWKRVPNAVGKVETTPPERVGADIDDLLAAHAGEMSFNAICDFHARDFHARFESIHPFQAGNGRAPG